MYIDKSLFIWNVKFKLLFIKFNATNTFEIPLPHDISLECIKIVIYITYSKTSNMMLFYTRKEI